MQQSSHIGNARREDRVPLHALIELRSDHEDEALTADVLDVSASGVGVRAAFVPEVGTQLYCDFRCPPEDDAVHAVGEVVWSTWDEPHSGCFGLRFLELDTKSATTIRRYLEPESAQVEAPEPKRVANMRIDGLAAPIEADVLLLEKDCIVLEQELSFLRLGRGIEVEVPGRGKERGRIATIELRQGPLDTPTLVFGVLLDEKPAAQPAQSLRGQDRVREDEREALAEEQPGSAMVEAMPRPSAAEDSAPRDPSAHEAETLRPAARVETPARVREQPQVVRMAASEARSSSEDAAEEAALQNRTPEFVVRLRALLSSLVVWVQATLLPRLRELTARAPAPLVSSAPEAAEASAEPVATDAPPAELPAPLPLTQRALLPLARASHALSQGLSKLKKQGGKRRRTTSPTPRVQRVQTVRSQRAEPAARPRNRRLLTLSLALVGVGLGVYALAPRSGADRIRVRARSVEPAVSAPVEPSLSAAPLPAPSAPLSVAAAAPSEPAAAAVSVVPLAAPAVAAPVAAGADDAEPSAGPARFGEANVPNGRTFVLRMSGPVRGLEGEKREDGFTVRIPGRLALDRASPIATSHRAVARALILNRGEYAELTVEFLPGMRPKYQVAGKDNTLEVTLERL